MEADGPNPAAGLIRRPRGAVTRDTTRPAVVTSAATAGRGSRTAKVKLKKTGSERKLLPDVVQVGKPLPFPVQRPLETVAARTQRMSHRQPERPPGPESQSGRTLTRHKCGNVARKSVFEVKIKDAASPEAAVAAAAGRVSCLKTARPPSSGLELQLGGRSISVFAAGSKANCSKVEPESRRRRRPQKVSKLAKAPLPRCPRWAARTLRSASAAR